MKHAIKNNADIYSRLLEAYSRDLNKMLSSRKPIKYLSEGDIANINIILKDVRFLLEGKVGGRYLSKLILTENAVPVSSAILTLTPYLVFLNEFSHSVDKDK